MSAAKKSAGLHEVFAGAAGAMAAVAAVASLDEDKAR